MIVLNSLGGVYSFMLRGVSCPLPNLAYVAANLKITDIVSSPCLSLTCVGRGDLF